MSQDIHIDISEIVGDLYKMGLNKAKVWGSTFSFKQPTSDELQTLRELSPKPYATTYAQNKREGFYALRPIESEAWDKIVSAVKGCNELVWIVSLLRNRPLPCIGLPEVQKLWFEETGIRIQKQRLARSFDKDGLTRVLHSMGLPIAAKIIENCYWLVHQKKFSGPADMPYYQRSLMDEELTLLGKIPFRKISYLDNYSFESEELKFFMAIAGTKTTRPYRSDLVNIALKKYRLPFHITQTVRYEGGTKIFLGYRLVVLLGDLNLSYAQEVLLKKKPKQTFADRLLKLTTTQRDGWYFADFTSRGFIKSSDQQAPFILFPWERLGNDCKMLLPNPQASPGSRHKVSMFFSNVTESNFNERASRVRPKVLVGKKKVETFSAYFSAYYRQTLSLVN